MSNQQQTGDGTTGEQQAGGKLPVTPVDAENSPTYEAVLGLGETEEFSVERGDHNNANVLVVAANRRVVDLRKVMERYREFPVRKRGTARLTTLDSLIRHTQRFMDENTAAFVDTSDMEKPRIVTVLDYNLAGADGRARWGEHQSIYNFPLSDEWRAWMEKNGEENSMTQTDFATFLEDRIIDVCSADRATAGSIAEKIAAHLNIKWASPQQVMQLASGVEVNSGAQSAEFVSTQLGTRQVVYKESHTGPAGAPLDIPGGFLIRIPIFKGDEPFVIPVLLRFRPRSMSWFYELFRPDKHLEMAVNDSVSKLVQATHVQAFDGIPEHLSQELRSLVSADEQRP